MFHDHSSAMFTTGATVALRDLGMSPLQEKTAFLGRIGAFAGKPFGWVGDKLLALLPKAGVSEATTKGLGTFSKGLAGEMGGFGLVQGGLEAFMGEPEDRLKNFGRGFGMGALQGLGWGVGQRGVSHGLGKLFPGKPGVPGSGYKALEETKLWGKEAPRTAAGKVDWGTRGKALGAKALPFAGGFLGSELISSPFGLSLFNKKNDQPIYAHAPVYGPLLSNRGATGMMPYDPYSQGMPQIPTY